MTASRPIVVGVDGSPSSLQAVAWATREAVLRGAPLTLMTTTLIPGAYSLPAGIPPIYFEDEEANARKRLARAEEIATTAAVGRDLDLHTSVRVIATTVVRLGGQAGASISRSI